MQGEVQDTNKGVQDSNALSLTIRLGLAFSLSASCRIHCSNLCRKVKLKIYTVIQALSPKWKLRDEV